MKVPTAFWVLIFMIIFFSLSEPNFLTIGNAINLSRQGAILIILCMGVIVVKIGGGIDLANGGIMTLAGMIMAWIVVKAGLPLFLGSLFAIFTGILFGLINGFFVAKLKIPPFVATLGTQFIAIGLSLGMNSGNVIVGFPKSASVIGNGNLFGVPIPLLITAFVIFVSNFLLSFTPFGVHVYALGGNEEALNLSGKSVVWTKILTYAYSGLTAGIAAIILTSRNMAAQPTVGQGMEFEAFAGVVLGGSFMAGRGTTVGALIGGLSILILRNGLNIMGIPTFMQLAIFGSVLIFAIVVSTLFERYLGRLN